MKDYFYSVFINLNSEVPDFEENAYYLTLKEAKNLAEWCKSDGYKTQIVEMGYNSPNVVEVSKKGAQ